MTVTKSLWFKMLCKQAQLTGKEGIILPPAMPNLALTEDESSADGSGGWQDPNHINPSPAAQVATAPVAGSTDIPAAEPLLEPVSTPDLDDNVALDESTQGAGIGFTPGAKPAPKPKSMMAGIPSAALWAAGGVGAAGLLGYLLSRNRRRNRDVEAA